MTLLFYSNLSYIDYRQSSTNKWQLAKFVIKTKLSRPTLNNSLKYGTFILDALQ